MKQNNLFEIEDSPSPRLQWLRKHNVDTYYNEDHFQEEGPWEAFIGKRFDAIGNANSKELCYPWESKFIAYGFETEDSAIAELAIRNEWKLWNEEEL